MKHAPNTSDTLRKFCDGTGLDPFEIDELKAAGYIAQNLQDRSWFLTTTGHVAVQRTGPLSLHVEDGAVSGRLQFCGEDSSQCPDEDSYLPPKRWNPKKAPAILESDPLDKQEGGTHYKDHAIQPIEYIHANKLGFIEGNVVKYITRHASKGGAEDVRKVIHYCELLLQLQYGEKA